MTTLGWPVNVIEELKKTYETFMTEHSIIARPLRYIDPAQSVGIFAVDLIPDQIKASLIGQLEPAINKYNYRIQNMVKATDEVTGRALFALDSKTVRVILYRDTDLLVRLSALEETFMDSLERFQRIGISQQRYLNNEMSKGQFVWLAQTDLWIETEVVKL